MAFHSYLCYMKRRGLLVPNGISSVLLSECSDADFFFPDHKKKPSLQKQKKTVTWRKSSTRPVLPLSSPGNQYEMIKCNKKLTFYSTFKTDVTTSNSLELITNQKHRQAVPKLRAGNHNLRIGTGRQSTPKTP